METALLAALIDGGGASATACLRWVVDGDPSVSGPSLRVDVRTLAPGDPTPF